ncbi:hypothetical protein F5Y13DRAFT_197045 [Hypoxylon sp. FL1857]|nr:hypothetical protein F5Y13DRAFT_197045 [Hypoxylon sp. FL1857]
MENLHRDESGKSQGDDSSPYPDPVDTPCPSCVKRGDGKHCWRCWLKFRTHRDSEKTEDTPSEDAFNQFWQQEPVDISTTEQTQRRLDLPGSEELSLSSLSHVQMKDDDSSDTSDKDKGEEKEERYKNVESKEQKRVQFEDCEKIHHNAPKETLYSVWKKFQDDKRKEIKHAEQNVKQYSEQNAKSHCNLLGRYGKNTYSLSTLGKWLQQCIVRSRRPVISLEDPHYRAKLWLCLFRQATFERAFNTLREEENLSLIVELIAWRPVL